jgi:hypothetical protein
MNKIVLIGGGTISHVRNHLALCAPAFGKTVLTLEQLFLSKIPKDGNISVVTYLTDMAGGKNLSTNQDVSKLVDELIADPTVRVIIFNPALVDFHGEVDGVPSGKYAERLETNQGMRDMRLYPAGKIIGKIRQDRKDIFVVGFKTTCKAEPDEQYKKGLNLLKTNSLNLVVANDTGTRNNMIIAPEETRYSETNDRYKMLHFLTDMVLSRMNNTFTRSTVVDGEAVDWNSKDIPVNLRTVVNHCIAFGAYKPFLNKTAGHFAVKINDKSIITSIRKTNFNQLDKVGMVRVDYDGIDKVIAHGAKPSVGGMSQKIIFTEHPEAECIVHFHCPPKKKYDVPTRPQWQNECGSHQCGANTSAGLKEVDLGGHKIKVVYLDGHGPNIVFNKSVPAELIIDYIDKTFDLSAKTGGLV